MKEIHALEIGLTNRTFNNEDKSKICKFITDSNYVASEIDVNNMIDIIKKSDYRFRYVILKGFGDPILNPCFFEHLKTIYDANIASEITVVSKVQISQFNKIQKNILNTYTNFYIRPQIENKEEKFEDEIFVGGLDYLNSRIKYGRYPFINMNFCYLQNTFAIVDRNEDFIKKRLEVGFLDSLI